MKKIKTMLFVLLILCGLSVKAQKIGVVFDSFVSDRWYLDQKLLTEKINALGGECLVEVANGDPAEQVKLSKKLIDKGVKVLIVIAVDAVKSAEIVTLAKASHVAVISYDRLIMSNDIAVYLSYNNTKVGELQAQYMVDRFPTGNYVLLNGPVADDNAVQFKSGQLKVLKPLIDKGKIKIIGDFVLNDWGEIGALMKMDDFFSSTTERPDVVIAANDALADGTIQAFPSDLVKKISITGQDADLGAIRNLISGKQTMTIYKPIKPLAYMAAEIAIKLAKGDKVSGATKFQSGTVTVDAIFLDPIVVDKSNYNETVVKDGHVKASELIIR
ncbi:MAG TPA: substrate-binding domain-containing protein [Chryseolinea sp.]|nr:substrate-binding domain-containing protein [Chryseolinea sp.]HPH45912.1 substrate-binding domain-containing protein [Chryseolinea sp.]HPM31952.1 substrate-binding domain-containing protein [Chryseolinea sp.]